jgi:dUTP pyrophosphatase
MKVRIKKTHPAAVMPTYATDGSGAFDLYAMSVMGAFQLGANVEEGHPVECDTGVAFEVPDGHVMLVFSRSGMGFKHGIRLANCVGVIDSDYRGSVKVKLTCDYDWKYDADGCLPYMVKPGDRIAQAIILPVPRIEFEWADELSETARGAGGFGSSGS